MDRTMIFFSQYCISVGFLCVLLYMYGFFPMKTSTDIFSTREDLPTILQDLRFRKEKLYNSSVGKTVLMVIDGLRVDFVTAENMPYTEGLVEGGRESACQLTARVSAPTVTLPRVKAIVTGSVSSFIDVVLNFGTVEMTSDNIIQQATRTKKVVFYGDDTWKKLFPHHFIRSEGTSSFFVNDYTEVDTNVTRHLDGELQRSDWDVMVLHYLGLDHIGHIDGPKSPLIRPKLREMDQIISRLHAYLQKQSGGLLVVCGDHGMKDSGSHGGVSLPEVLVPVLVLGLSCHSHPTEEILQADLAATLSVLWGAPIPADNVGVAAAELLGHLTPAQRCYAWLYNAQQLANNFLRNGGTSHHESYLKFEEAKLRHYEWLTNSSTVSHHQVEALYRVSLISMSRFLSEVLANYDILALSFATAVVLQVMCMAGLNLAGAPLPLVSFRAVIGFTVVAVCSLFLAVSLTIVLLFTFNTFLFYRQLKFMSLVLKKVSRPSWSALLYVGTLLFCVSLFSSSMLEEEHQLWYFLWVTVALLRFAENPTRWLCVLAAHRFLRALNQTGDRWAHLPDISDWLTQPHNKPLLSAFHVLSLACLCWCCAKMLSNRLSIPVYVGSAVCIYLYKASVQQVFNFTSSSGMTEARVCWLLIGLVLLLSRSLDSLVVSWMLASCLLLRPHNTILVPSLFVVSRTVLLPRSSTLPTTVLYHWLGLVFFFYQGNSNSLASIDVAAGYVGLKEYNITVVAALLFIHTYSMPVLSYLLNIHSIVNQNKHWRVEVIRSEQMVVFLQLLHVFFCLIAITLHRYHLFVWTVFSPKLLYIAAQTFIYFLLTSITNICVYCAHRKNHL